MSDPCGCATRTKRFSAAHRAGNLLLVDAGLFFLFLVHLLTPLSFHILYGFERGYDGVIDVFSLPHHRAPQSGVVFLNIDKRSSSLRFC